MAAGKFTSPRAVTIATSAIVPNADHHVSNNGSSDDAGTHVDISTGHVASVLRCDRLQQYTPQISMVHTVKMGPSPATAPLRQYTRSA